MKQFAAFLCLPLIAAISVNPGYKYQQPGGLQASQAVRQNVPVGNLRPIQLTSSNGIYSSQQAPPLSHFGGSSVQHQHQHHHHHQQQQQSVVTQQQILQSAPVQLPAPAPVQYAVPAPLFVPSPQVPQTSYGQPVQQQQQVLTQNVYQPQGGFQQQQQTFQSYQQQPQTIITKDIYIHSAPEDQEEAALGQQLASAPIRKNYRIVFIKAPAQNLRVATAALQRAQQANEDKTVIYVLSKKPDLSEVQEQLRVAQTQPKVHKPEVYFIKYKTQEEAQRAQQEIQAQYDALGGSTSISDEGVAPVRSVIGSTSGDFNVVSGAANLSGPIRGAANLSGPIVPVQSAGNVQQQFAQQSYQTSAASTSSYEGSPVRSYLPPTGRAIK